MHSSHIQLRLAQERRAIQIREAAEHRLGLAGRGHGRQGSIRRSLGRSLIRVGSALARDPEPTFQPARPR